jgi:hypothetical protein
MFYTTCTKTRSLTQSISCSALYISTIAVKSAWVGPDPHAKNQESDNRGSREIKQEMIRKTSFAAVCLGCDYTNRSPPSDSLASRFRSDSAARAALSIAAALAAYRGNAEGTTNETRATE